MSNSNQNQTVEPLDWKSLDPAERYRRATWEGLLIIQQTDEYVFLTQGEEKWEEFSNATRPGWAGPIGRKLVADHPEELTPDIEGALKLMAVYGAEVWGSGRRDKTRIEKLSNTEGRLRIIDNGCPQWYATTKELRGTFPCNKACGKEMDSVVKALGPQFEVKTIEGRPLGHSECIWRIQRSDQSETSAPVVSDNV